MMEYEEYEASRGVSASAGFFILLGLVGAGLVIGADVGASRDRQSGAGNGHAFEPPCGEELFVVVAPERWRLQWCRGRPQYVVERRVVVCEQFPMLGIVSTTSDTVRSAPKHSTGRARSATSCRSISERFVSGA